MFQPEFKQDSQCSVAGSDCRMNGSCGVPPGDCWSLLFVLNCAVATSSKTHMYLAQVIQFNEHHLFQFRTKVSSYLYCLSVEMVCHIALKFRMAAAEVTCNWIYKPVFLPCVSLIILFLF